LLELFPRIYLSGILGKIQFLCALCDSAVIVSIFLQTEHIYDNHYRSPMDSAAFDVSFMKHIVALRFFNLFSV